MSTAYAYRTAASIDADALATLRRILKKTSSRRVVVLVYATWCGHCHTFRPQWQSFVRRRGHWTTIEIEFSALEAIKSADKWLFRSIVGDPKQPVYVPMILAFDGSRRHAYDGERTARALAQYLSTLDGTAAHSGGAFLTLKDLQKELRRVRV